MVVHTCVWLLLANLLNARCIRYGLNTICCQGDFYPDHEVENTFFYISQDSPPMKGILKGVSGICEWVDYLQYSPRGMLLTSVCEGCPEDRTLIPYPLHNLVTFITFKFDNKHINRNWCEVTEINS